MIETEVGANQKLIERNTAGVREAGRVMREGRGERAMKGRLRKSSRVEVGAERSNVIGWSRGGSGQQQEEMKIGRRSRRENCRARGRSMDGERRYTWRPW